MIWYFYKTVRPGRMVEIAKGKTNVAVGVNLRKWAEARTDGKRAEKGGGEIHTGKKTQ